MNQTTDGAAVFAPLWRRKWLILIVGVLVAVGTYFYYKHERPTYLSTTQIYLGAGAEEQVQISGSGSSAAKKSAAQEPSAQATLINSALIKEPVHDALRKEHKTSAVKAALKGKTKAKTSEKSEFITLSAEAHNARGAALLANLTAQTYVRRQNGKYKRAVEAALNLTRRQLRRIEASEEAKTIEASNSSTKGKHSGSSGPTTSDTLQAATLATKLNQLEAELGIVSVKQLDPANRKTAQSLTTSPKKNAIFGFAIGVLLAAFAAYALARVDHRLRSLAEIEAVFETEILTALRSVRQPVTHSDGYPRPSQFLREPLQRLHTTLQVGNVKDQEGRGQPRKLLFVSADAGDGQSTVVADLALVQRDAGEAVAILDADLRRPTLAKLLGLNAHPGLADVLEGRLSVSEASQEVGVVPAGAGSQQAGTVAERVASAGEAPAGGPAAVLVGGTRPAGGSAVLLSGTPVANPPALLASDAMGETLSSVAAEFDYVLLDGPPPLEVSDIMPLLRLVDGIVIVARTGQTRENSARRLVQLLARTPSAPILGVVANGVAQREIEKYGFSASSRRGWLSRLIGR
jgi:Mrp family chromosome partitioning ATPase